LQERLGLGLRGGADPAGTNTKIVVVGHREGRNVRNPERNRRRRRNSNVRALMVLWSKSLL
jgi:hypothetical protein